MGWVDGVLIFMGCGTVGAMAMAVMAAAGRASDAEDRHLEALARTTEREAS